MELLRDEEIFETLSYLRFSGFWAGNAEGFIGRKFLNIT